MGSAKPLLQLQELDTVGRRDRQLRRVDETTDPELDPIRKVVFQELSEFARGLAFIGVEQGQDPSDELLVFFVRAWFGTVSVRPLSAARSLFTFPITERATGRAGIVLSIESIKQMGTDKYEVIAFESAGSLCSSWRTLTVERAAAEWTVTESRLTGQS
jgi:hypothetical protein